MRSKEEFNILNKKYTRDLYNKLETSAPIRTSRLLLVKNNYVKKNSIRTRSYGD